MLKLIEQKIDCGTPSSVTGATRSYSSTVLNSVVTYACQTGYTHTSGDLQRVCGSDSKWGGNLPKCTVGKYFYCSCSY